MTRTEEAAHIRSLFRQRGFAASLDLVRRVRDIAIDYLPPAVVAKVPPPYFSDEIRAEFLAIGQSLDWDLTIGGATGAYAFFFAARDVGLTRSQQSASSLLYACTEALEGDTSDRVLQNILDAYAGLDADAVATGNKFKQGRTKGALGPVAKRVASYLKSHPKAPAEEVWAALKARPPKGYRFMDGSSLGRYVERGAKEVMGWKRFQDTVSEQRPEGAKRKRRKSAT